MAHIADCRKGQVVLAVDTRSSNATSQPEAFLVVVLALVAAACSGGISGAPSSNAGSLKAPSLGASSSTGSPSLTRDPQVIVDALDAAGLALCHSDYTDLAEYNIYGILGASATWRFFPHHSAVPMHSDKTDGLSCITANQPSTGAIGIDSAPGTDLAADAQPNHEQEPTLMLNEAAIVASVADRAAAAERAATIRRSTPRHDSAIDDSRRKWRLGLRLRSRSMPHRLGGTHQMTAGQPWRGV